MANFVKFTNASLFHDGNDLYINLDQITTVYTNNVSDDNGKINQTTILYSASGDKFWEVKETLDQVKEMLKNA